MTNWIPCTECMPEAGQRVIIYTPKYKEICCDYTWKTGYGGDIDNNFFAPYTSGYSCIRDATHWMPMPEAPKENGE